MLLTDIALITSLIVFVIYWWGMKLPARMTVLVGVTSLVIILGVVGVLDDRWQAGIGTLVGIIFMSVLLFKRWRSTKVKAGIPYVTGIIFSILGVLASLIIYLFPINNLPAPSGQYQVGVRDFELVDQSRTGLIADDKGAPRRLLVRAWYPTDNVEGLNTRPYFKDNEVDTTAGSFANNLIQMPFFFKYLKHANTHSYENAPILAGENKLTTLFYSHGYMSFNGQNTILMEELASHGYIIYSVMHTYDSSDVVFPSGMVQQTDKNLIVNRKEAMEAYKDEAFIKAFFGKTFEERYFGQLENHEKSVKRNDRYASVSAAIWLEDRLFVHDSLINGDVPLNAKDLALASNLSNTGEMGMSYGGSTTGAVCMIDVRCGAGVNLDGGDFHFTPFGKNMPVPFLMLYSDFDVNAKNYSKMLGIDNPSAKSQGMNSFSYERPEVSSLRSDIYRFMAKDALHLGYSDLTHFVRRPIRDFLFGATNGDEMIQLQNQVILGFFDKHLRGYENNFPNNEMAAHSETLIKEDLSELRAWWIEQHPEDRTIEVVLETELGEIELALYPERAPLSVDKFLIVLNEGLLNGASIIQEGISAKVILNTKSLAINSSSVTFIPEPAEKSGISNERGVIGYSQLLPSDKSLVIHINMDYGKNTKRNDSSELATFGRVLRGMNILKQLQSLPGDENSKVESITISKHHSVRKGSL